MNNESLQRFCNRVVEAGCITRADARQLGRSILRDGLACRDEADMLIALERAVPEIDPGFRDLLAGLIVDFAVWGERPTGYVDRDVAGWLAASLGGRSGPTPLGARIAREVIQAAESSDEALLAFALSASPRRGATRDMGPPVPMAA
ncbi:MAG TPA: hypothetical protein VF641_12255 [Methylobacterium sp.]|jgi:hypothetical protein